MLKIRKFGTVVYVESHIHLSGVMRTLSSCIVLAFCAIAAVNVAAQTITREQLPGSWCPPEPSGLAEHTVNLFLPRTPTHLAIDDSFGVTLTRSLGNGDSVSLAGPDDIQFYEGDVFIISFRDGLKLVLSGWSTASTKMIFGQLLSYHEGNVINGISMSFEHGCDHVSK